MTLGTSDVRRLTAEGHGGPEGSVPRPGSRRATRVVLPVVIVLGVLAVGGYAAWKVFRPLTEVWVMPVISRPSLRLAGGAGDSQGSGAGTRAAPSDGSPVASAPAWVEPDPYPVTVPALTAGVVKEILALEGQRVEKGDVLARLDTTDAELALRRAEAERDAARGAEAVAASAVHAAQSRKKEIEDEIGSGATATGSDPARLEQRRRQAEEAVVQAGAALAEARALLGAHEIGVEQAALDLQRREIRAPISGLVVSRMVEPGSHVGMSMAMASEGGGGGGGMAGMPGMGRPANSGSSEGMTGGVMRLFDPSKLQARAEVAVADSIRIAVGMPAQMTTEAAPDLVFRGKVTRIVPAVDLLKNSVDIKVAIENGEGILRPGMQMRIRFFAAEAPATEEAAPPPVPDQPAPARPASGGSRLMVPKRGLRDFNGDKAKVLVVTGEKPGSAATVSARDVSIMADPDGDYVEVSGPVTAGERVVVRAAAEIQPGDRVKIAGEMTPQRN